MAEFGDEHGDDLIVAIDIHVEFGEVCDGSRFHWSAINHFEGSWGFQLKQRQVVITSELLICKCITSCTAVYKGMSWDIGNIIQFHRNNYMVPIQ